MRGISHKEVMANDGISWKGHSRPSSPGLDNAGRRPRSPIRAERRRPRPGQRILVGPIVEECTFHALFVDDAEVTREGRWQPCLSTVGEHPVTKPAWARELIR